MTVASIVITLNTKFILYIHPTTLILQHYTASVYMFTFTALL